MAIYATRPDSNYDPCPEGLHHGVCVDVIDLGIVKGQYGEKHKIRIVWQVEAVNEQTDRRHTVSKQYTLSMHEKATLRKDLEGWRSRKFTDADLAPPGFDIEKLIGANCQLHVVHTLKDDGRIFGNVAAIVPPPKNVPKLVPLDYVRERDRKHSNGSGQATVPQDDDAVPF